MRYPHITAVVAIAAALNSANAFAAVPALAVGASETFTCTGTSYRTRTVIHDAIADGTVTYRIILDGKEEVRSGALWMRGTTMNLIRPDPKGGTRRMQVEHGTFQGLEHLPFEQSFEGWVWESRPGRRLHWHYSVRVGTPWMNREAGLPPVEVVDVVESRYAGSYTSRLVTLFSVSTGEKLRWEYTGSKGERHLCVRT